VQAARLFHARTQLDIGSATGHVRRNSDGAFLTRLRNDVGLLLVLLCIQNRVRNLGAREHATKRLRYLDRRRADQNGLTILTPLVGFFLVAWVRGPDAARRWSEAVASIADPDASPAYGGLRIEPRVGLLPLGRDGRSGLWEFAVAGTGTPPERGLDGRLAVGEDTAVVLVLVPGGAFEMGSRPPGPGHPAGAPNVDAESYPSEWPVHPVELEPFFLGKHELTQGQWVRLAGDNASFLTAEHASNPDWSERYTLAHPVDSVSWHRAVDVLHRAGLTLPTEAQWEYAARAGTTTVRWTGDDPRALDGAANLADRRWATSPGYFGGHEAWLDDGWTASAPVGSYAPNPFGLHDVLGNLWEWCLDPTASYGMARWPGTGERVSGNTRFRCLRGGAYNTPAAVLRSAQRQEHPPEQGRVDIGLRAAREL